MRTPTPLRNPFVASLVLLSLSLSPSFAQDVEPTFRRGDVNADALVDIADATSLLGCLFLGARCPSCPDAADSNDDGSLDMSDAIHVLSWLFLGGGAPPDPGPSSCGIDPTADRLGWCEATSTDCGPETVQDPTLVDIVSRLHYASRAEPEEAEEEPEDVQETRIIGVFRPREVIYDPRPDGAVSWNSRAGRAQLEGLAHMHADLEGAATHLPGGVVGEILHGVNGPACVEPDYFVTAGDRQFGGWSGVKFQAPANAFDNPGAARNFLVKVQAEQPFFLPYRHRDVRLGAGWYYNTDPDEPKKLHRACDYSRRDVPEDSDPTFRVYSAGSGVVAATGWDHNGGNYVAIESTAPGGQKVMFVYLHLRNGRTNDVANALSSTSTDDKYVKYRAFATDYPEHLSWGDDEDTIDVTPGQLVSAGQGIAWAGNTGAGGAGGGLNSDGSPQNWKGNTHLHVYVAVPHPTVNNTWVWVDPYGVYEEADTGCYDLLKDTQFSRLYAPFYPTFHGVPYEVFSYYFGYYPNMGLELQTLSVHRADSRLLVSGSFQTGVEGNAWILHCYMDGVRFEDELQARWQQGFVPREVTVEKTRGGSPRYSAIWRPRRQGESIEYRSIASNETYNSLWDQRVTGQDWRIEDWFPYTAGSTGRHSVLFTSDRGRPFASIGLATEEVMASTASQLAANGLVPLSLNVFQQGNSRRYSALYGQRSGCWEIWFDMSSSAYQEKSQELGEAGFSLWKVQGYANSTRFAAIWRKPDCP